MSDPYDPAQEGAQMAFDGRMSYGDYLSIDTLLDAQHPRSDAHDEMLFIIQHQTSELWLKLLVHELGAALRALRRDEVGLVQKILARVKQVQRQLFEQWAVLETLTPAEYAQFRDVLGPSSGFQSLQYRMVEFLLGNKNARMLSVFEADPDNHAMLEALLHEPSVYDEFLRYLARAGYDVPTEVLERDVTKGYVMNEQLISTFKTIYENPAEHWLAYETCEEFVDLEDNFQLWRFRHLKTVARIIGGKRGTGGSSGIGFLQKALDLTFFPELFAVRTEIG